MDSTVGTCSLCGGRVTVPSPWYGVIPPTPRCESCGAAAADHGPVIQMRPAEERNVIEDAVWKHKMGMIDTVERNSILFDYL